MKNFRTYQLARSLYQECRSVKLTGCHKDQFDRAILSIILNLAEGSGKLTRKDRRRFYSMALGSLREVQALMDIHNYNQLFKSADRVGAHIYCLVQNPGGSS